MSQEGMSKFISRVQSVIETSRNCGEITCGEVVGALELMKIDVYMEAREDDEERQCCDCKWEFDLDIDGRQSCPFKKICERYPFRMFERKTDEETE